MGTHVVQVFGSVIAMVRSPLSLSILAVVVSHSGLLIMTRVRADRQLGSEAPSNNDLTRAMWMR